MTNPLLERWTGQYEMPPFSQIQDIHFEEAFSLAMAKAKTNYKKIYSNKDVPTFKNTIEEMEKADNVLNKVSRVFFNLTGADSNVERQNIQLKIAPQLAQFNSEILTNSKLWARVKTIFENNDKTRLTKEQIRVTHLYHQMFIRAGAKLVETEKIRYQEIMSKLAILGTKFSQNLLADESSWYLTLSSNDLDGLPEFLIDSLSKNADEQNVGGYVMTLSRSTVVPFLQFSSHRHLRRKVYEAWVSRGNNKGDTNNLAIVLETLELRKERSQILGYDNFSNFKLETEMAKTPENVKELLMSVWKPAKLKAENDSKQLQNLLSNDGVNDVLQPWDWRYYSEKRRLNNFNINEVEIQNHLQLNKIIEAAFYCAKRLFNLDFTFIELSLYHPDARAWEVKRDGEHMAIFIGDYYARSSKRSGAWCSSFRGQSKFDGNVRPIVLNICNFTMPKEGKPCLLSFDEATTLFHEFGHALHVILSDVSYPFVSGTSVARDFVELPSQLFEHWLEVPEILQKFAVHYETGQPISEQLINKLHKAKNIDQGFSTVEYVASAIVDLSFHEGSVPKDPLQRQNEVLKNIGMPSAIDMRHATSQFSHIFSGDGYSSGYYSYMWSEVMDADAFNAFEEKNDPFDVKTAKALHDCILSKGGSVPPEEAYINFRGKLPDVKALLEQRGFLEKTSIKK
tara:strand:- start:2741 stop:4780 length:2040 start_codon:yes stop_codon:yes gene_type:complete